MVFAGGASYQIGTSGGEPVVTVTAGDSLWRIAQEYGVSVNALAAANHMRLTDTLLVGRRLVIPTGSAAAAAPTTGSPPAAETPAVTPAGSPAQSAKRAAQAERADQVDFCQTFRPQPGPTGVLPWLLSDQPARLSALRPVFVQWADAYGVSPALLEAIAWQESGWQQNVVSGSGAIGIGQILPGTARFVNEALLHERLNVRSTTGNVQLAARYLAFLSGETGGDLCETIAAYNEGLGNLDTYGVFPVTQQYVADVESLLPRFE